MSGKRIIIVDDEADFVSMLAKNLEIFGYEPEECTTPRQVLNRFRKQSYDWALVDYRMPEMNGDLLVREIEALDTSCKIIMLTGFLLESEVRNIMEANPRINACLQKPFDVQELVNVIERNSRGQG